MCSPWDADEKIHLEHYYNLIRLFESPQSDNMKTLRALIHPKEDLHSGATKTKVLSQIPLYLPKLKFELKNEK